MVVKGLRDGFRTRFDPTLQLYTSAALVHPGHKNLSWLTTNQKSQAIEKFKEELYEVSGLDYQGNPIPSSNDSMESLSQIMRKEETSSVSVTDVDSEENRAKSFLDSDDEDDEACAYLFNI